jgi:hypothetical protein
VFILLETIYKAFEIAKRRRVFKVGLSAIVMSLWPDYSTS